MCADTSTHTKTGRNGQKRQKKQKKYIMCHVIHVMYHLSLTQTATATNPPPANSPIMHSRLVLKSQKFQIFFYIETEKERKKVMVC